jgi:hypothetical protein
VSRSHLLVAVIATGILIVGCQSAPDKLDVIHPPQDGTHHFTSFSTKLPPARAGYSPALLGQLWGAPTPVQISGYDYMQRFTPGAPIASAVIYQQLTISGVHTRSVVTSCDTGVPFAVTVREYFKAPNNDVFCFPGSTPTTTTAATS